MKQAQTVIRAGAGLLLAAALTWWVARTIRDSAPYSVGAEALSGWRLAVGEPGDAALVALQPPAELSADLFQQLHRRRRAPSLVAPARAAVPLVLKSEYAESLQGVLSIDDILNVAREAGVETARFEPVCMAERRNPSPGRSDRLLFVLLHAPAFYSFRQQLSPLFPEHAGSGIFDPGALRPILIIAASDGDFARWFPIAVNQERECGPSVRTD